MLPKKNRLTSKYEFNKVKYLSSKGKTRFTGSLFNISYAKINDYDGPVRFGIVVPNKLEKSAAKRNRVKRLYRESLRQHSDKMVDGCWAVIYPKAASLEKSYEDINTELTKALQDIHLTR